MSMLSKWDGSYSSPTRPNTRKGKYARVLAVILASLIGSASHAADHVWISTPGFSSTNPAASKSQSENRSNSGTPNSSTNDVTLPPVLIVGSTINWGSGYFDSDFTESYFSMGSGSIGGGIAGARDRAVDLSDVCKNPLVSSDTKTTTSTSDATSRWLAAQNLFSSTAASNLLPLYWQALPIRVIVDGKYLSGYKVTYADGWSEVWVVNPGHATSSFKLFDTPAPNSLKPPEANNPGCQT